MDVHPRTVLADSLQSESVGNLAHFQYGLVTGQVQVAVALLIHDPLRPVHHILTLVAALGEVPSVATQQFTVAHVQAFAQFEHLRACVVDIVLALHIVAGRVQHIGDRVTQRQVSPRTHVEGAGGIDAAILHLDPLALTQIHVAKGFASFQHGFDLLGQPTLIQGDVDKARWCHIHLRDIGDLLHTVDDAPANLDRVECRFFRLFERPVDGGDHLQGQAGGIVAVILLPGALDEHLRNLGAGQATLALRLSRCIVDKIRDLVSDHPIPSIPNSDHSHLGGWRTISAV